MYIHWFFSSCFLLFFTCNFVVVATTQLHSNNKTTRIRTTTTKRLSYCLLNRNVCRLIFLSMLCFMCNFVVVATTKLQSNNNNNKYKKDCMSDHWTVNVCRLIFLFLLLFFMCHFIVVAVTKLDSNNNNKYNNNNKKITLHSSTDQFNLRTHIYWIRVLILLHCNVLLTLVVYIILGHQIPLQGVCLTVHCLLNCIPQHVKMTLCSTAPGHQMPLLGGNLTWVCLTVHVKLTLHLTVNV